MKTTDKRIVGLAEVGSIVHDSQRNFIDESDLYIGELESYRKLFTSYYDELSTRNNNEFKKYYSNEIVKLDNLSESVIENAKIAEKWIPSKDSLESCKDNRKRVLAYLQSILGIIIKEVQNEN